ncbi:MAG: nitroreductase family protein [Gammaproteobacteria bacterium]|nr:nitroreductase family protein [Gammaproteobacteria bacterium]
MSPASTADLYSVMSTLRAVRRLKPDPIPDDVLERILQAAAWAPSGGNVQPWRIVAVREPSIRAEIGKLYAPQWESYSRAAKLNLERLEGDVKAKQARMLAACDYLGEHMGEAPVLLVFCFNPAHMAITDIDLDRPSVVGGGSVYPALQNAMLACVQEGVGCTLTTLLCYEEKAMRALLQIPEDWYTCAVMPIGYPILGGHGTISRRPVSKLVYEDTFGTAITLQH